jgi:hypothetical protein
VHQHRGVVQRDMSHRVLDKLQIVSGQSGKVPDVMARISKLLCQSADELITHFVVAQRSSGPSQVLQQEHSIEKPTVVGRYIHIMTEQYVYLQKN